MSLLISIDPGQQKCGLVLVDKDLDIVLDGKVVLKNSVIKLIKIWEENFSIDCIFLGNGTSSKYWQSEIKTNTTITIKLVEEKNTTFRARDRYWELWPKNFILRLIPGKLVIPSDNLDAIAALLIVEDYLNKKFKWTKKTEFKIWP